MSARVETPVPPSATATSVPVHTPVVIVPTDVSEDAKIVEFSEVLVAEPTTVPVSVSPAAVTVIAAVPSKFVPLMALAVAKAVAVAALPVVEPDVPDALPVKLAVIVPAAKLPEASRITSVLAVFAVAWLVPVTVPFKTAVVRVLLVRVSEPARVASVPVIGSVTPVAAVAVSVVENAPDVTSVEPSANSKVAVVAGAVIVTLLMLVAVVIANVDKPVTPNVPLAFKFVNEFPFKS